MPRPIRTTAGTSTSRDLMGLYCERLLAGLGAADCSWLTPSLVSQARACLADSRIRVVPVPPDALVERFG